jgi:hypothetical protein
MTIRILTVLLVAAVTLPGNYKPDPKTDTTVVAQRFCPNGRC